MLWNCPQVFWSVLEDGKNVHILMVQTFTSLVDMLSYHPVDAISDLHNVSKDLKMNQPLAFEETQSKTKHCTTAIHNTCAHAHASVHTHTHPFQTQEMDLFTRCFRRFGKRWKSECHITSKWIPFDYINNPVSQRAFGHWGPLIPT